MTKQCISESGSCSASLRAGLLIDLAVFNPLRNTGARNSAKS